MWWIPVTVAGLACLGVWVVLVTTHAPYAGQHVLADPQEEWDAWSAEQGRGSMVLAEERGYTHPMSDAGWLPAPPVDPEPWRQQIAAELSPEALEPLPEVVLPDVGGWISGPCLDDPGPGDAGDSSSPASSGPAECSRWLAEQLAVLHAWSDWQQQKAAILA